jgi:hypothetical protein
VPADVVEDRRAVDDLVAVDSGHGAADDVAGVVAARARGGDAHRAEALENLREILDAQPVELEGLARGDVAEAVAEILGDAAERRELRRVELPAGNLGAEHEIAAVLRALAVDTVPLEAVEVVFRNRLEADLGVAIDVVNDVEAILDDFELFLRRGAVDEVTRSR